MNIYQQRLLDHYRYPRNAGTLDSPDFTSGEHNPSCGDSIGWQGSVRGETVQVLKFTGKGCVLSQATASLLSEHCTGKSVQDIAILDSDFVQSMVGMHLGLMRIKCVLLPLHALQKGLVSVKNS